MIYSKYMLTPGVEFDDGDFFAKPSAEEADETVKQENYAVTAYALMGFDPESEKWEVLIVTYRSTTLVRNVRMMFGIEVDWDGSAPMEFDRSDGIVAVEYMTSMGLRVRAWRGLMVGCLAAYADNEADWLRFEEVAKRLGVTIKVE